MRRFLARLIQLVLCLLLIGILWGGWYMHYKGFSRKWRNHLTYELRKRGIELFCDRLTLDPFRGIVAENVRIEDKRSHAITWARIDEVVLDINYSNLLHHQPFLEALDLRDAHLSLPIDPAASPVEFSHLNARLLLPPHEAYLSDASADVCGVHVSARGRLANPDAYHPASSAPAAGRGSHAESINGVLAEIRKFQFKSGPPQLVIRFSGDLAKPEKIFAEATLWGQGVERDGYQLQNLYAAMTLRDGVFELKRATAGDATGTLEAAGNFDMSGSRAAFQLRSSLDLQQLAHVLHIAPLLGECVFYKPPQLEISGETVPTSEDPGGFRILGHLLLNRFACKSVIFDRLGAAFSWSGGHWYVSDFRLGHQTGSVRTTAMAIPGDFHLKLDSDINPRVFLPFLSGETAQNLADWDFRQSPKVHLDVRGPTPDFGACEARGEIKLGRTLMRGMPMNSGTAGILIKDRAVTYQNFKIDRDEGTGTGTFTYDFGRHLARMEQVKTTLNTEVAIWLDADLAHALLPYRFKRRPSLTLNGIVDCDKGKDTNLEVLVDGSDGMDYTFIKRNLPIQKITGKVLFTDDRLQLIDVDATLFKGRVQGSADISLARNNPVYQAFVHAGDTDFESLTKLYFDYANSHGLLDGEFRFRGRGDDPRALRGQGSVTVVNGNVFAIPVLGPFSGILNDIVPGMGFNLAHKGTCSFNVQDGVIDTSDFVVKGQGFSMIGGGKIFFVDDKLDFNIRLNAQGLPGVLLFPVSKLLEYGSEGSFTKPAWRPKRLPAFNHGS